MQSQPPLRFLAPICLMPVVALAQAPVVPRPPATPKRPMTDEYGAIKVTDDYRWLENWDNPEVKQWSAANGSDHPILLRTTSSAGHGIGTALDERIEQGADFFSFLFDQLGIKYTPPAN
jgi:protease II